jgi:uncharacterized protein (DUF58 family)
VEPARATLWRSHLLSFSSVSLLLGLGLEVNAVAVLGAAGLVLALLAWAVAQRRLRGLRGRRELYPSAFEEDGVEVDLVLEADRPTRLVELADVFGPAMVLEQRLLEPGPVGPGLARRLSYRAFCSRQWGIYPVGPLQVVAADPAGLFHAWKRIPEVADFAVFPRVYDVAGLSEAGARETFAPRENSAGRSGRSLLYLGVREYRPGDGLRHIHWPASARRGTLVVKEYELDLCPYLTIFVDLDRRHRAGTGRKSTFEYVMRTAASAVWSAQQSGSFVQVLGAGSRELHVPPGRGRDHLTTALYELIRAQQDGTLPFAELVLARLPHVPPRSTAVLVSGTAFLDLAALGEILEGFHDRGVRPLVFLVDNFGFPAIEGWPPPRVEIVERQREVVFFLKSRGVPVRLLRESDDLETVLGPKGLDP